MPNTVTNPQIDNNSVDDPVVTKSKTTAETTNSTTSPLYTYSTFIRRLHSTSCLTVLTHIRKYMMEPFWILPHSFRFIHGLYEAAQRPLSNISSLVTSYHTFFRFIMARLLHSEEFVGMDEHGIIWARVAMECLLTTELYPVYEPFTFHYL